MSIASLGIAGSLAATPLPQKAADADKSIREAVDQSRQVQAARQAEAAAGIGQTEEDSEASERDADGRRLWEQSAAKLQPAAQEAQAEISQLPLSKDPSGETGSELDLVG